MERVRVDDVEPDDVIPGLCVLTGPLGATELAINHYDVAPGGWIGGGYHTHHDQEEVFYVLSGVATFVTENGDVKVGPGGVVRFAPGDFQHGYNGEEEPLALIAVGAPPNSQEVEDVRECPSCGEGFHHRRPSFRARGIGPDDPARRVTCPECGAAAHRIGRPD